MHSWKIKKLDKEKRFGFLTGVAGRKQDLFFHFSGMDAEFMEKSDSFDSLSVGDVVEFDEIKKTKDGTRDGDKACGIRLVRLCEVETSQKAEV